MIQCSLFFLTFMYHNLSSFISVSVLMPHHLQQLIAVLQNSPYVSVQTCWNFYLRIQIMCTLKPNATQIQAECVITFQSSVPFIFSTVLFHLVPKMILCCSYVFNSYAFHYSFTFRLCKWFISGKYKIWKLSTGCDGVDWIGLAQNGIYL